MPAPRRHPPGTYWRGQTLWAKVKVAGTLHRRTLDTDDPKTAAERREAYRKELVGRAKWGEANRSLAETIAAWSEHLADRVSASTEERYLLSLKVLSPWLDGLALADVNGSLIADIIAGRRAAGIAVATIKRDLGALSQVMGFAIDEGWIEANPVLPRLGRLKERRDPIALPSHAHIEIVALRAAGRLQDMIRAALLTGCRQAELSTAKTSQFDPLRRQLTVIGKGRRRRTIDLSPDAVAVVTPPKGHTWLFQDEGGLPYRHIKTRWRKLCHGLEGTRTGPDNDGVIPFRFHDLRHRFAVDYLKAGRSLYELQQHLGHSSVKTTEIYVDHLTPQERQRAMFGVPTFVPPPEPPSLSVPRRPRVRKTDVTSSKAKKMPVSKQKPKTAK